MEDHYSNETNGSVVASHKTLRQMVHREMLRTAKQYITVLNIRQEHLFKPNSAWKVSDDWLPNQEGTRLRKWYHSSRAKSNKLNETLTF